MLECFEEYALEHKLLFSTDPTASKSRSKCIYMTGKLRHQTCSNELILFGQHLPWADQATRIYHILHISGIVEKNAEVNRAKFTEKTLELTETFSFACQEQVLRAIQIYACDCYRAMILTFQGWLLNLASNRRILV